MLRHYIFVLLAVLLVSAQQDYSCSPDKPCKLGCCGKNNVSPIHVAKALSRKIYHFISNKLFLTSHQSQVCGMGPSYCAPENCTSSYNEKSECDPGWGSKWSMRDKCPLNVCCSKFGFCGTTKEFCGDAKVKKPSCSGGTSAGKRVIGYYEGWSTAKSCNGSK